MSKGLLEEMTVIDLDPTESDGRVVACSREKYHFSFISGSGSSFGMSALLQCKILHTVLSLISRLLISYKSTCRAKGKHMPMDLAELDRANCRSFGPTPVRILDIGPQHDRGGSGHEMSMD